MRPGFNQDDMEKWKSLLTWKWHTDPNMVSLWFHLLALADENGTLVTSRKSLSQATGISERSIRTCLSRLVATNRVTSKTTNKNSVITLCLTRGYNGSKIQSDQQNDQLPTSKTTSKNECLTDCCTNGYMVVENTERPAKRPADDKERKEPKERNIYNNIYPPPYNAHVRERLESLTVQNDLWLNQTAMNLRTDDVVELASEVMDGWEISQIPESEWTAYHLISGMRKLQQIRKSQARPTKADEKSEWRAKMMRSITNDLTNNGNSTQQ